MRLMSEYELATGDVGQMSTDQELIANFRRADPQTPDALLQEGHVKVGWPQGRRKPLARALSIANMVVGTVWWVS